MSGWGACCAGVFSTFLLVVPIAVEAREPAGYQAGELLWEGQQRHYLLHVPTNHRDPAPLVIALHGAGEDAAMFAGETGFAAAADARGMVLVVPDGTALGPHAMAWNAHFCCAARANDSVDDIGFLGTLIDHLAAVMPIDRKRVYATGMSNGGMLAYQLAASHPEWLAAVAPVSAAIGGTGRLGERYMMEAPHGPVPVMIIHGARDPLVRFAGGWSEPFRNFPPHWNTGVDDAVVAWRGIDGCLPRPDSSEPLAGKLRRSIYLNCRNDTSVIVWEIEDGGHNWPGTDVSFPAADGTLLTAAEEILAFFAVHEKE